jgi:hypothetical protein
MLLRGEAARKPRQLAGRADDPVAGRDDRDRILAVCRPYCPERRRPPELTRDLAIAASLAERDCEQRLPDALLKLGPLEIEGHSERAQRSREIRAKLSLGLEQDWVFRILGERAKPDAPRVIILPQDRRKALLAGTSFRPPTGEPIIL